MVNNDKIISMKLPTGMLKKLDAMCKSLQRSRSCFIRDLIAERIAYLNRKI